MSTAPYLRLRQVCLVARDLDRAETVLTQVLGLKVAFRDERITHYGLENALLPLGTSFIEVVAPIRDGTAAGRFLDRYHERRGYMAIFDCDDLDAVRNRVQALDMRILHERRWPRYHNLQLHPRDTGATLVEIHHNVGGEALDGHYDPSGEGWQSFIRDDVSVALLGIELRAGDPQALAQRWSRLLDKPLVAEPAGGFSMALDAGVLRFLPGDGDEWLDAVSVSVRDVPAVLAEAARLGCTVDGTSVDICGVWFRLSAA